MHRQKKWHKRLSDLNNELINKIKGVYLSQIDFYDDSFKKSTHSNELLETLNDSSSFLSFNQEFEQLVSDAIERYFIQINHLINDTPQSIRFSWNEKMFQKNIFINGSLNRKKQKILKQLKKG